MKLRSIVIGFVALAAAAAAGGLSFVAYQADHDPQYASVVSIADAATYQDPTLIERAWALPVAALYREGGYEYQANPSFCGPASAANMMQSQGVDVDQRGVIEGSNVRPIFGLLPRGVSLNTEAELVRAASGQPVEVLRDLTLEQFRAHIAESNDPDVRYIINFHRGPLWGSGHGHFSPVLGYLADADLVFVGDVNDAFRPFLVPTARLFEAMDTIDSDGNLKRGLLRIDVSAPPRA
ncbi:MAG: phytochelatin synthase family protein [Hyphomonadaceae bacterium]